MKKLNHGPLVLIPYVATVRLQGGLPFFIERLIRHCSAQGQRVERLIIPRWFEYSIVWPGLKAGQLLSRGLGTTWAFLCRGIYITVMLWGRWFLTGERAICFATEPPLLVFVGWFKRLSMIGVYSEGPLSKEEAVRTGVWRENHPQQLGIRLLMAVERLSCRRAGRIVADSPSGWEKMVSVLGTPADKGEVIWQAIDIDQKAANENDRHTLRERLGWSGDTIVAIFTGQLYRIKGIDILFEVMRQEPDDRLRLVVLGTGVLESSLRRACRSDPVLGSRIFMAGFQNSVYDFLRGSDIFVLPSRQEGTSTSLLEALSIELPVVGTDVGGIHDVLTAANCGLLVPPENPEALAHALRKLMDEPERRRSMGRRGRDFVRLNCRAENMATHYIQLFREMTSPVSEKYTAPVTWGRRVDD
jgi:glycosyltransferase involved in cell wall biosynthesis